MAPLISSPSQESLALNNQAPERAEDLLHRLFERTAESYSDAVALVGAHGSYRYDEADRRANRLARYLRAEGVGPGSSVGLWLPRSADLFIAMLAILKSGAAYVPLDPSYPWERVEYILEDSGAHALISSGVLLDPDAPVPCRALRLDEIGLAIDRESDRPLGSDEVALSPSDLCYTIYTSGSTGRPKGVQIEHRAACSFVRAAIEVYGVRATDRVYQGFSVAFDASVEEIWMAFATGAALIIGESDELRAGAGLAEFLTAHRVTFFSTTPTLLSILEGDLPTVRILILGGEKCPAELVRRWCRLGRCLLNTYGPTEATVVATYAVCDPTRPVTIGRAMPNGYLRLLNDRMQPVAVGEVGELYLGGSALARGYVNQPELTRDRFIADPWSDDPSARLYRTGDLGRWTDDGEVDFVGRADGQVKLRGYRVELSEIEAVLLEDPSFRCAVVTLVESTPGVQQLAAYLVLRAGSTLNRGKTLDRLRERLPEYMVPTFLEPLDELPTLTSGKADLKRLPPPSSVPEDGTEIAAVPESETERKVADVWSRLLGRAAVSIDANFFTDLGGHSLLAARMVSALRANSGMQEIGMLEIYAHPTIRALSAEIDTRRSRTPDLDRRQKVDCRPVSDWKVAACGMAQIVGLYLVYGVVSLLFFGPLVTRGWVERGGAVAGERLTAVVVAWLILFYPFLMGLGIAAKWVLIGRYRPGDHPLWGTYYFRFWLVRRLTALASPESLAGTPLMPFYLRLMGARVGRNCHVGTPHIQCYDLLDLGDGASVGMDAHLLGFTVEGGRLRIGGVRIGRNATIGSNCVLGIDTEVRDGACLDELSMLPEGHLVPSGERWSGSPADRIGYADDVVAAETAPLFSRVAFAILFAAVIPVLFALPVIAALPGWWLIGHAVSAHSAAAVLAVAPPSALAFVLILSLEIAAAIRAIGRVEAGVYPTASSAYYRIWLVDRLMHLSMSMTGSLYATLYLQPWLRLLGARIGPRVEVASVLHLTPNLLDIGEGSFVADAVSVGAHQVDRGWVRVASTRIGARTFIGNSAVLPPGSQIGSQSLIGCLSSPPQHLERTPDRTSWLGSPAIFLPRREIDSTFSDAETYQPPAGLYPVRLFIEAFRVLLPSSLAAAAGAGLWSVWSALAGRTSAVTQILTLPLLLLAASAGVALAVVALKWVVIGRYRPQKRPLWNLFVWRSELVTGVYEQAAVPALVAALQGTPLLPAFMRLMGVQCGQRVYLDTTLVTEFDLVSIGDDTEVNTSAILQTHLFEDRVMKMSHVVVGSQCVLGNRCVALYDSVMETGSTLNSLSLLMKGESLPAWSRWQGVPARRMTDAMLAVADCQHEPCAEASIGFARAAV